MNTKNVTYIKETLSLPILLVGMMGAGKSYIGRALSERLSIPFVDSDAEIVKHTGKAISDIFAQDGEVAFREAEHGVIRTLLSQPPHIIATGGGAVVKPETLALIKEQGLVVWLNPSLSTIWSRIKDETHRPLLDCDTPQDVLEQLMSERRALYAQAPVHINDDVLTAENSVEKILQRIAEHLK